MRLVQGTSLPGDWRKKQLNQQTKHQAQTPATCLLYNCINSALVFPHAKIFPPNIRGFALSFSLSFRTVGAKERTWLVKFGTLCSHQQQENANRHVAWLHGRQRETWRLTCDNFNDVHFPLLINARSLLSRAFTATKIKSWWERRHFTIKIDKFSQNLPFRKLLENDGKVVLINFHLRDNHLRLHPQTEINRSPILS